MKPRGAHAASARGGGVTKVAQMRTRLGVSSLLRKITQNIRGNCAPKYRTTGEEGLNFRSQHCLPALHKPRKGERKRVCTKASKGVAGK